MRAVLRRESRRRWLPISLAFNPRGDTSIIAVRTRRVNFACCAFGIARTERSSRKQRVERRQTGAKYRNNGRDDWIRTSGLTHPKGARYRAALRPDRSPGRAEYAPGGWMQGITRLREASRRPAGRRANPAESCG